MVRFAIVLATCATFVASNAAQATQPAEGTSSWFLETDPLKACPEGSVYLFLPEASVDGKVVMPFGDMTRTGFDCTKTGKHQYAVIGVTSTPVDTIMEAVQAVARKAMEVLVAPAKAWDMNAADGTSSDGSKSGTGGRTTSGTAGGTDGGGSYSYGGCRCTVGPGGLLGHI